LGVQEDGYYYEMGREVGPYRRLFFKGGRIVSSGILQRH
jgi:hypothetical protein